MGSNEGLGITLARQVRTNYGFVANIEQAITDNLGVFSRATWSPGLVEIIGWTDCDESLSFGAVLKGTAWGRPNDKIGVGGVVEGLSPEARAYFATGGLGILIGDGALASNGIAISMDGRGAWRDNVFVERLWRSVKYEEVYLRAYETVSEARNSIGRYLDFYNGRRPHSSLDGSTPDQAYFNPLPIRMAA